MKNKINFNRIILLFAIIGIVISGCNKTEDIIPEKWQGTYELLNPTNNDFIIVTLDKNGVLSWEGWNGIALPNGSYPNVTIVNGGKLSSPHGTGEWVYLAINGVNRGIIIHLNYDFAYQEWRIGLGSWGASEIINGFLNDEDCEFSSVPEHYLFMGFPLGYSRNYGLAIIKHEESLRQAMQFQEEEKYDLAINLFSREIEINPTNAFAYYYRSYIYSLTNDYESALKDFLFIIENGSYSSQNDYLSLGITYYFNKEYDRAIEMINQAISISIEPFSWGYIIRGMAYEGKNELEKAITDWETAINLNPDDNDMVQDAMRNIERVRQLL